MQKRFDYQSVAEAPRITKVIVNAGVGKIITSNPTTKDRLLKDISEDLALITGQKPKLILSNKSISSFKLREGMAVGLIASLRGQRMFDFLSRLINIALPRTRDFRGIPVQSFDPKGNLNIGVKEHLIFPEVASELKKVVFGFQITIATNAKTRDEGIELLRLMGFPIKF